MITDADQKAAAAFSHVAEAKGESSRVPEKRNESEGKFGVIDGEFGRRLIRLNSFLDN